MNYANGEPVLQCGADIGGLRIPGANCANGKKINIELVKNNDCFLELLNYWIFPAIQNINGLNENEIVHLFYEGAEEECSSFLGIFTDYVMFEGAIWPMCPVANICAGVDQSLPDTLCYMKLRIKVICIFLNSLPNQAFHEGQNWSVGFLSDITADDYLEIEDNMEFSLRFDSVEGLFPRTLHNNSNEPRSIRIIYNKVNYQITMPAYGCLRTVFGNKGCTSLVSIKGNISFNDGNARNAVIQWPKKEELSLYLYHRANNQAYRLDIPGIFFTDAAANGAGGARVLTNGGIYDTGTRKIVKKEKMPIRVYGAGKFWAIHYADYSLECNMQRNHVPINGVPTDKVPTDKVLAVVENGAASLLIRDENSAWQYIRGNWEEIPDEEFVENMIMRFACCEGNNYCENGKTGWMDLRICRDGMLKW